LSIIETRFPISLKDIIKEISAEIEKPEEAGQIIRKFLMAEKIQQANGLFLPKKKVVDYEDEIKEGMVAYEEFLTPQELGKGK
jgi:hypothetical protein